MGGKIELPVRLLVQARNDLTTYFQKSNDIPDYMVLLALEKIRLAANILMENNKP